MQAGGLHVDQVAQLAVDRAGTGEVIALDGVFHHHLPIGRDGEILAGMGPHPLEIREPARHLLGKARRPQMQRPGVGIEIDEDEAREFLHPHRRQAEIRLVEARQPLAALRRPQRAVGAIGPGVVGAGDRGLDVAAPLQELMGAVLADIVEGAQPPVAPADGEHPLAQDIDGGIVARACELAGMAQRPPGFEEDRLFLPLEHFPAVIPGGRQREGGGGVVRKAPQREGIGHGRSLR